MEYIVNYKTLKEFARNVFLKMNCSEEDAETAADVLVTSDLRGVDSHGVARLGGYVRLWEKGRINSVPAFKIERETLSTAVLNADRALGMVAGKKAMELAIEKASEAGSAWVAVNNSNHYSIAGYYSMMALKHNMIGFSMTNASPLVSPTHSKSRLLGTNPISVAFPAGEEPPLVIDMATTAVANGKLEVLHRKNQRIPLGWAQDAKGALSDDPLALTKGGAMLPLGSDYNHGSYKGYCLGGMVDIFTGVLSGANFGPWVPPFVAFLEPREDEVGKGIGHFFGAMRVDAFQSAEVFLNKMDIWIQTFRDAEKINPENEILVPGDPERRFTEKRMKNGIPVYYKVYDNLKEIADRLSVDFTISSDGAG